MPRLLLLLVLANFCLICYGQDQYSVPSLIAAAGLPVERHNVTTDDGYILGVYRIPATESPVKKTVLMVHGLSTNSACFVANLLNNTLSFLLHNQGFDVWLINLRGTRYSLAHKSLDPDDKAFWQFSFTEFGIKDIPAVMDFITEYTGVENISLVGHSEGTASCFVTLSMLPEYAKRVPVYLSMSPAVFINHTKQELFLLANKLHLAPLLAELGISHVGGGTIGEYAPSWFCNLPLAKILCDAVVQEMAGWDYSGLNPDRMGVYASMKDASSVKNLNHGFQCLNSGEFKMFDYGRDGNIAHYGQESPPYFPIDSITTPIALLYGGVDKFVVPYDVEQYLIPALSGQTWLAKPELIPEFNHIDPVFHWGGKFYQDMVDFIERFN